MAKFGQKIWMTIFLMFGVCFDSAIALAQETAQSAPTMSPWWVEQLQLFIGSFPELNAWLIAILAFSSVFLRVLSEFLAFIASKTETKSDDKWAEIVAKGAWGAAALFGWFGGGKSKKLVERQLEKEATK